MSRSSGLLFPSFPSDLTERIVDIGEVRCWNGDTRCLLCFNGGEDVRRPSDIRCRHTVCTGKGELFAVGSGWRRRLLGLLLAADDGNRVRSLTRH